MAGNCANPGSTGDSDMTMEMDTAAVIAGSSASLSSSTVPQQSVVVAKAVPKGKTFLESKNKVQYCGVPSCNTKSDRLTFASASALTYFGFKERLAIVKICDGCRKKAEEFEKKSVEVIRNCGNLFSLRHEPQSMLPETVNLEEDRSLNVARPHSSRRRDELVEVDFERNDVNGIVRSIMSKYKVNNQVNNCVRKCTEEALNLGTQLDELEEKMNTIDTSLYDSYKMYNRTFDKRPKPIIVQEMEINADGSVRRRNITNDNTVIVNSESLKKLAGLCNKSAEDKTAEVAAEQIQKSEGEEDTLNQSIIALPDIPRKPGPASETKYYETLDAKRGPFDKEVELPEELRQKKAMGLKATPQFIPRLQPKVNEIVYAMSKNLLHFWIKGEILEVVHNEATNQTEFIVYYEPTRNDMPTGGIERDDTVRLIRQLCLKQMAYNHPCPFILPVGSRVIAKFRDEICSADSPTNGQYYAGVVAEPPKATSKNRYLIFFDDGYAQYVYPQDVLLVCESSSRVWNDVYPDMYDFIKEYITRWPQWPMVKLHVGQVVSTEWNGKWMPSRIIEIDNCLARARFVNDNREEWIYRGSTRFRPIFSKLGALAESNRLQQETNSKENKIPRHDPEEYKNRKGPLLEYNNDDSNDMTVSHKVARKSTGRIQYYEELLEFTGSGAGSTYINMLDPDLCIEFQGTLSKIKIPQDAPKPKEFTPHTCGSACVIKYEPTKELKQASPLAVPFFLGWAREVTRAPRHFVFYRAPCGIRFRNYDELESYLDQTDCNLPIHHFCFDYAVDCLNEFVPGRALRSLKDMSYGKENVPVQCINSVDYDELPYMEYTPARVADPSVPYSTDENFLVCCDCTDNCQDKSKCACWQLTHQGISFTKLTNEINPIKSYEHGRLRNHIVSGIYECNSKCKCKQTCNNRVVQKGVQWPLQLFKTTKKGWGIRALYDMPEGTFICSYSGRIVSDHTANTEGLEQGDEYMADLDFIECNDHVKEDYESDVTDIEAKDSDSDEDMEKKPDSVKEVRGDEAGEMGDPEILDASLNELRSKTAAVTPKRKFAARRTMGEITRAPPTESHVLNNDDEIITARDPQFGPKLNSSKRKRKRRSVRELYGKGTAGEEMYLIDAKIQGNIGRYLNHSCTPNVFVQNVFVETHDLRFPLVSFFTNDFVRAGTELTWDYHYEIGSVPDKLLYCFCMTPHCRGRLL